MSQFFSDSSTSDSTIVTRRANLSNISEGRGDVAISEGGSSPYLYLLIIEDYQNQRIFYLDGEKYNLGRSRDNSIVIYDRQVSRCHATLVKEYNEDKQLFFYKIYDGDLKEKLSTNGLFVNGKRFKNKDLQHGDFIRFSERATAHYFVLDKNSKITEIFSLTKTQDTGEIKSNFTKDEIDRMTLTSDEIFRKQIDGDRYHYLSKSASISELSPYPIIEVNLQGQITYCNEAATLKFQEIFAKKLSHPLLNNILKTQDNIYGSLFIREVQIAGQIFEQYIHYLPNLQLIRSYIFDITERKQFEAKLKDSEAKYRAIIEQTSDGIFLVDADSKQIIEANRAACDLLGYSLPELVMKKVDDILVKNQDIFNEYLATLKSDRQNIRQELECQTKQSKIIDVEMSISRISYQNKAIFCLSFRNITERKLLEKKLQHIAYHDTLTGLYNRILFNEHLTKALANAKRAKIMMSIMFLDLDKFKEINDSYGHNIGDGLLKEFAQRLRSCIRVGDSIARWGGDEFIILLPKIESKDDVRKIAERILLSLQRPFQLNEYNLPISSSIGISIYPDDASDAETLIKKADIALYCTKGRGRNNFLFFDNCHP